MGGLPERDLRGHGLEGGAEGRRQVLIVGTRRGGRVRRHGIARRGLRDVRLVDVRLRNFGVLPTRLRRRRTLATIRNGGAPTAGTAFGGMGLMNCFGHDNSPFSAAQDATRACTTGRPLTTPPRPTQT